MIPKEIIEKAIKGGWEADADWINSLPAYAQKQVICDPTFWQALQRALFDPKKTSVVYWRTLALEFVRLVLNGQPTEPFWVDLLAKDQS